MNDEWLDACFARDIKRKKWIEKEKKEDEYLCELSYLQSKGYLTERRQAKDGGARPQGIDYYAR